MKDETFFPKREPDMIRRMRILYIKKYFEEHTDEEHAVSMSEIIAYLDEQGIPAERKSIRDDINALIEYGMDIELENGKKWKLLSREFDVSEIQLLIDLVASSKFLSDAKSKELISKLEALVSIQQKRSLGRQLYVVGRVKSMNKNVLYSVDAIHKAIETGADIEFMYYQYNMHKKRDYKHEGKVYHVVPQYLLYDNNTYYLLAKEGDSLKTFRIDRMDKINIIPTDQYAYYRARTRRNSSFDSSSFFKSTFGMYQGEVTKVTMRFKKEMMDTVIDRFGEDVPVKIVDDNHFEVTTPIAVSPQFFGWIFGLGDNVIIKHPLKVAKQMKDLLKERHKAYREECGAAIYRA